MHSVMRLLIVGAICLSIGANCLSIGGDSHNSEIVISEFPLYDRVGIAEFDADAIGTMQN